MKTSELNGAALDWAVAKCEGLLCFGYAANVVDRFALIDSDDHWELFEPSREWECGGPIIEREVISLIHPKYDCWTAHCYDKTLDDESYTLDGPTPLIAAMRCYVASKLGDEVEIPEELK
jgi:hypothetical protein